MGFELKDLLQVDLKSLIEAIGYVGLFLMVFLESGMLIGFFFPGDSLLFTAGLLASVGKFNIVILSLGCFIAAVSGDGVGYYLGKKFGRRLFQKEKSLFFNKSHLEKSERFYQKHGGKTIVLARFIPVIRAFAPVVAGMSKMNYSSFLFYNLFGAFIWAVGITLLGYYTGETLPEKYIDRFLLPIILLIIILSISPALIHMAIDKSKRN